MKKRDGAILMLVALVLPVVFILGAFAINMAYIQLSRTELMVATDAATRAAGRAFSELQDVDAALGIAQATAAMNTVGGRVLRLDLNDHANEVEFGSAGQDTSDGRFTFSKVPTASVREKRDSADAIRITGRLTSGSQTGPLTSLFPTFVGSQEFQLSSQAVAMQVDRDIALVLDRSGSMTTRQFNWPKGFSPWSPESVEAGLKNGFLRRENGIFRFNKGRYAYYSFLHTDYYEFGPSTLWGHLVSAVDGFLTVLEETVQNEQVSLTTYSHSPNLDLDLQLDYNLIRERLDEIEIGGGTAIGRGMQTGFPTLLGPYARPFAAKTIVVMTDGRHNSGISPDVVAESIVSGHEITIHTVTFGSGADQDLMKRVAEIGHGKHYHADNGTELVEVFKEIANNLPTIITN